MWRRSFFTSLDLHNKSESNIATSKLNLIRGDLSISGSSGPNQGKFEQYPIILSFVKSMLFQLCANSFLIFRIILIS